MVPPLAGWMARRRARAPRRGRPHRAGAAALAAAAAAALQPVGRARPAPRAARRAAGGARPAAAPARHAAAGGEPGARRAANQAGAFAVNPRHAAALAGRRVLLVDDVLTTGRDALGLRRLPARGRGGAASTCWPWPALPSRIRSAYSRAADEARHPLRHALLRLLLRRPAAPRRQGRRVRGDRPRRRAGAAGGDGRSARGGARTVPQIFIGGEHVGGFRRDLRARAARASSTALLRGLS